MHAISPGRSGLYFQDGPTSALSIFGVTFVASLSTLPVIFGSDKQTWYPIERPNLRHLTPKSGFQYTNSSKLIPFFFETRTQWSSGTGT